MPIFSSGGFGAWRTPGDGGSPLIAMRTRATGELVLTVRPGADVGDLVAILGTLPADAFFTEHFGDVNAVLVFRRVPGDSATLPASVNPSAGPAAASVPLP
ncbi:hypothetical protein CcI156_08775 [Frankia sp. CcI156]|nr:MULTISPECIES: hypothetical protein [unclassified Frankia]ETA03991.1 hypothetical protein CcI6DRAFT_00515 [Frankia sp. CcI6]KFB06889.1 Frankia-40 domain [Frankia sp. Allo2]OHV54955.1 hypothetical protein CgIS1_02320 [Frankia sp. CgIS1]ONH27201.1 hypothetical protein CcI156_08775 [Frankia sp. CcI156]